jgi:hypothetical protein
VISVGRTVSSVAERLHARPRAGYEGYVFCSEDNFWFRPAYTEGKCPLCGAAAVGGALPQPRWQRVDRSWFGTAGLALESLVMLTLVLFMYFRR